MNESSSRPITLDLFETTPNAKATTTVEKLRVLSTQLAEKRRLAQLEWAPPSIPKTRFR